MKTNFLVKLFLFTLVCVSLNSCTVDEVSTTPKTKTDTSTTARDGDPMLPSPRK